MLQHAASETDTTVWSSFLDERYGRSRTVVAGWALYAPSSDGLWRAFRLYPRDRRFDATVRKNGDRVSVVEWHAGITVERFFERAAIDDYVPDDVADGLRVAPRLGEGRAFRLDVVDGALLRADNGGGADDRDALGRACSLRGEEDGPLDRMLDPDGPAALRSTLHALFPDELADARLRLENNAMLPADAVRRWSTTAQAAQTAEVADDAPQVAVALNLLPVRRRCGCGGRCGCGAHGFRVFVACVTFATFGGAFFVGHVLVKALGLS